MAVVDIAYDHGSGFYANGSMVGGRRDGDNLTVVGLIGNVGYARRLTPRLTLDTGLVRVDHLQHYGPDTTGRYTEGYVGAAMGAVSARVSYSPDYLRRGVRTLYGEVNGGLDLAAKLRLSGHLGYLGCLDAPATRPCYDRYDWRVGLARQFDRLELHASLTGAKAPSGQSLRLGHDPALVLGAAWTF